ncbi:MAG TPA: glycosyltransferase [Verrucomicrobiae bacterium]|nr:glycosyltransferase [Verrucomicrobiae bacterium]
MISFIVPAHNEQACLGRTLQAIQESAHLVGKPFEIIVVDDASTDATAEIARQHQACVVSVNHRQIAATRNSGARAAKGEWFFFVDADTTINARAVASALRAMDKGAVGGGGMTRVDKNESVPLYARLLLALLLFAPKLVGFTGGAFMFCTRAAFQATGGFNEQLYWAEEGGFALALKRQGRFFVPWQHVLTSGRRLRTMSGGQLLMGGVRMMFSPVKFLTRRSSVEHVWYNSNRADDDKMPNSIGVQLSNGVALVIVILVVTGPVWDFIPWTLTPLDSPQGKFRYVTGIFLCHLGTMGWPIGLVLLVNVLRQKRWTGLIQSAALIGICFWQAWESTHAVVRIWTHFLGWLAHFHIR